MAASAATARKILQILNDELQSQEQVAVVIDRLRYETTPSGNKSYDVTVGILFAIVHNLV
jgi:hypothetical protein